MKKLTMSTITILVFFCTLFGCLPGTTSAELLRKREIRMIEKVYGQNKDSVLGELKLSGADIRESTGLEDSLVLLTKKREIGWLTFQCLLLFDLPEGFAGERLIFVSDEEKTSDSVLLDSLKKIYSEVVKAYGEPVSEADVQRYNMALFIEENPDRFYSTYDSWNLSDKTELTMKTYKADGERVVIELTYRWKSQ